MKLTSWGNHPIIDAKVCAPKKDEISKLKFKGIARGLGRSYGDSALSTSVIKLTKLNKFIYFDSKEGLLHCESGVSLGEILEAYVQKGWFLFVTPGTKFVTLGGAIASDVHGKNHHIEGSFCDYVVSITLFVSGDFIECTREVNADLFYATCGGMGLTGIIIDATFKLRSIKSAYINQKKIKAKNLEGLLNLFDRHAAYTYSVAWIDCMSKRNNLGRSILMLGEHSTEGDLKTHQKNKLSIPFNMPSLLINKYLIKAFNYLYANKQLKNEVNSFIHYGSFFYPLDGINNWNRIYGTKGFTQYQFVIPHKYGKDGIAEILEAVSQSNHASFLAVLKVFGNKNNNLLSFPISGYTLSIDFKLSDKLFDFLDCLDDIVQKYGGRLYLSKDVRMSEKMFKSTYPNWEDFKLLRKKYGIDKAYFSLQSKRIGL
jgi:decaprenylphospho-beta-D-ribofuranose 2-oxidase